MLKSIVPALCLMILVFSTFADQGQRIRPAAVAGSWYPGEQAQLGAYLDRLLQGESRGDSSQGRVRALISPHAGYRYSGAIAADGYRLLRGQTYKRVVLLGPTHHADFQGLSIADVSHYQTPLGRVPLDLEAVDRLRKSAMVTADPTAHRQEHSLEMQLPFLQRVLEPGWQLVPILVGDMQDIDYLLAAELLRPLLDEDTLVVVSSDFTHYGRNFRYLPFPLDRHTPSRLSELDRGSLAHILNKDPQGFLDYKHRSGSTICGYRAIALLLHLLPPDSEVRLIGYDNSGHLTGDYSSSVSYMSIAVWVEEKATADQQDSSSELSLEDMKLLHRLASMAVASAALPGDQTAWRQLQQLQQDIPTRLHMPAAAFVTLWKTDRLRGCIGSNKPDKPLYRAVMVNGIHAALHDDRFSPLQAQELAGLDIEVSVLTPANQIASLDDLVLGQDGIIIEKDRHFALYLPEAAQKYGWNHEQLLQRLSRKAGLPDDGWKHGASFKTFRTQSYRAAFQGIQR